MKTILLLALIAVSVYGTTNISLPNPNDDAPVIDWLDTLYADYGCTTPEGYTESSEHGVYVKIPTNIAKCLTYTVDGDELWDSDDVYCTSCEDGYVVVNNMCVEQTASPIANCVSWSFNNYSAVWNKATYVCDTCDDGYVGKADADNSNLITSCESRDKTNCNTWVSTAKDSDCQNCKRGEYLDAGECKTSTLANCAQFNSGSIADKDCDFCVEGYLLYTGGADPECVAVPETAPIENCLEHSLEGVDANTKFHCSVCAEGYYMQVQNETDPTKNTCEAVVDSWTGYDANCALYHGEKSSTSLQCIACKSGYEWATNAKACVACPKTYKASASLLSFSAVVLAVVLALL